MNPAPPPIVHKRKIRWLSPKARIRAHVRAHNRKLRRKLLVQARKEAITQYKSAAKANT